MLNGLVRRMDGSVAADAATVAESRTTTGCHLRVSLGLAPPPASSFLYYDVGRRHTPGHPDRGPGRGPRRRPRHRRPRRGGAAWRRPWARRAAESTYASTAVVP